MYKKIIQNIIFIFIVILHLGSKMSVFAQSSDAFDLGLTPTTAYLHVEPGKELTHTIILKNEAIFSLNLSPHLVTFSTDQKSGIPIFEKKSLINILKNKLESPEKLSQGETSSPKQNSLILNNEKEMFLNQYFSFINPDVKWNEEFTLKPGEEKRIVINIAPPKLEPTQEEKASLNDDQFQILEQEHHLTIIFAGSSKYSPQFENTQAQVSGFLASNIIAFFSNEKNDAGKLVIEKVETMKVVDSFSQISFSVLGKNVGRNATPISGKASITNLSNQKLVEYIFYPDMILANSSREIRAVNKEIWEKISAKLEKQPENSELLNRELVSQLEDTFQYKNPFLFGIYNLNVELENETKNFKVVALPISVIIISVIALTIFIAHNFLRRKMKN